MKISTNLVQLRRAKEFYLIRTMRATMRVCLAGVAVVAAGADTQPAAGELSLKVTASLPDAVVRVGEPIVVRLRFENTGSVPVVMPFSSETRVGEFKASGLLPTWNFDGPRSFRYGIEGNTVVPGGARVVKAVLNRYLKVEASGHYIVSYSGSYRDVVDGDWGNVVRDFTTSFDLEVEEGVPRISGEQFREELSANNRDDARVAFESVLYSSFPEQRELLIEFAGDERFSSFRLEAIQGLARYLPDDVCRRAIAALPRQNETMALRAALEAFHRAKDRYPSEALMKWFEKSDPAVRPRAAGYLEEIDPSAYADELVRLRMP